MRASLNHVANNNGGWSGHCATESLQSVLFEKLNQHQANALKYMIKKKEEVLVNLANAAGIAYQFVGSAVALWLVRRTPVRVVRVRALDGALRCVLGQDKNKTLIVPLSTQFTAQGSPAMD